MSKIINNGMFTSASEEWATPQEFFDRLDSEFHFTLDVCATEENAKCSRFFTKDQDGLKQDWGHETVWCNPPYGRGIGAWCQKCYEHFVGGGYSSNAYPSQNGNRLVPSVGIWQR